MRNAALAQATSTGEEEESDFLWQQRNGVINKTNQQPIIACIEEFELLGSCDPSFNDYDCPDLRDTNTAGPMYFNAKALAELKRQTGV